MRHAVKRSAPVRGFCRTIAVDAKHSAKRPGGVVVAWQHPVSVQVHRALPAGVSDVSGIVRSQDASSVSSVFDVYGDHRRYEVGIDLIDDVPG